MQRRRVTGSERDNASEGEYLHSCAMFVHKLCDETEDAFISIDISMLHTPCKIHV